MSRRFSIHFANACAERLIAWLTPHCERIHIAGSIRRKCSDIGDVDLVCIPKIQPFLDLFGAPMTPRNLTAHEIKRRCLAEAWLIIKAGPTYLVFEGGGVQVDLWFCTEETWGTVLMCRTGSKEHNIWLAGLARKRGGHWDPHHGLLLPGHRGQFSRTETEIYTAIGVGFIPPEARDRNFPEPTNPVHQIQ
jgi:DNA polymerase (family X)